MRKLRRTAAKNGGTTVPSVVSKTGARAPFGNDTNVVSKRRAGASFGNDTPTPVVTKPPGDGKLGNDAMFVRVRRRTLKGGHPEWREYRERTGRLVTAATSYDVVRAVRIDGKPRQKFLFGLGSLKENTTGRELARFWIYAERRMQKHGLSDHQQQRLIEAMVRKGAPRPSSDQVEKLQEERKELERKYPDFMAALREAAP